MKLIGTQVEKQEEVLGKKKQPVGFLHTPFTKGQMHFLPHIITVLSALRIIS